MKCAKNSALKMVILAALQRNSGEVTPSSKICMTKCLSRFPRQQGPTVRRAFFGLSIVWTTQGHTSFFFLELTTGTGSLIILLRKDLR